MAYIYKRYAVLVKIHWFSLVSQETSDWLKFFNVFFFSFFFYFSSLPFCFPSVMRPCTLLFYKCIYHFVSEDMLNSWLVIIFRLWKQLDALIHPFFDELRDPNARLPNGRFLPPLFNFKSHGKKSVPKNLNLFSI